MSDTLLECFSTLSPQSRDEELEDLIYFILDLYQFHGIPVATAEVDITQVVVDIRTVLEELQVKIKFPQAKTSRSKATAKTKGENSVEKYSSNDHHTFLILDKNVQGLPWESIPVLRGRSVSRIPNIESLLDRVQWAKWQKEQKQDARSSGTLSKEDSNTGDRVVIDPRKTFFILNPSGDLKKTEGRFNEWLNEMRSVGWDGIIGCSPSEQQLVDALTRNDLLM